MITESLIIHESQHYGGNKIRVRNEYGTLGLGNVATA